MSKAKKDFDKVKDDGIIIYLDLDGVIADFDAHARACGKIKPDGKVDFDALDFKWWSTMPAAAGAKGFYDQSKKLAKTKFLTSPVLSPGCFGGKAEWLMRFVPARGKFILRDLTITSDKAACAAWNRILIDDRAENIKEWVAAGGIGILHKGDFGATMKHLEAALDAIRAASGPATPKTKTPKP